MAMTIPEWRAQRAARVSDRGRVVRHARIREIAAGLTAAALRTRWASLAGLPYAPTAAARYTALSTRKLDTDRIGAFEAQMGIDEARRHVADDDV
jgi:hypothetical protein